jgi:lipoate---protein ligase
MPRCDKETIDMRRLDLSLDDPAMNLALDEALLVHAEQGGGEAIRFWRFDRPVVVLGRGSRIRGEVDLDFCERERIPVLRRCSGGASIVAGPDCLMYSVVLDLVTRPQLRSVDEAHEFVIGKLAMAVQSQRAEVRRQGICDLTLDNKKFSGNSLRIAKNHLLYHGTLLERVDRDLVQKCLATAPRQPAYRDGREHDEFITSIAIDPIAFCNNLAHLYGATATSDVWPSNETQALFESKYSQSQWHWRH